MTQDARQIEKILAANRVAFERLDPAEQEDVRTRWLQTFAGNVKRETGSWVHNRFRWHGFSYGFEAATEGQDALRAYQGQWCASFVVFGEADGWAYRCHADRYPDFTPLGEDIYVAHHNMKWTIAFTHEQPDIGPFFAERFG